MKANDILEGTARSRITNDKWSGTDVDVLVSLDSNKLRVRNFLNDSFEVDTPWKQDALKQFEQALNDLNVSDDIQRTASRAIWKMMYESVSDEEAFIEEQIVEVMDVAERLIKSMLLQYSEKQRYVIEEFIKDVLHDPENIEQALQYVRVNK